MPVGGSAMGQPHWCAFSEKTSISMSASQNDGIE
jgi:hypothetical protein